MQQRPTQIALQGTPCSLSLFTCYCYYLLLTSLAYRKTGCIHLNPAHVNNLDPIWGWQVEAMEASWNRIRTISGADSPDEVIAYWQGVHELVLVCGVRLRPLVARQSSAWTPCHVLRFPGLNVYLVSRASEERGAP